MKLLTIHKLKTSALFVSSILLVHSQSVFAGVVSGPGNNATVNPGDPSETWTVSNGAGLNVSGGNTDQISLSRGSELTINGGNVVNTTGNRSGAIVLSNSNATIDGANISNPTGRGITLAATGTLESSSRANISNSTVSGTEFGISLIPGAALTLTNTSVYGANGSLPGAAGGGIGLLMLGGDANIQGSQITGDKNGLMLSPHTYSTTPTVILDNTVITGTSGSGIVVGDAAGNYDTVAEIILKNGTVVNSGNGIALEVKDNNTANATIDNSHIEGDIQVDEGSHANVTLQNNGQLTGTMQNVDTLAIDNSSQWNMTGDSQVGDLTLNGGSVKFGDIDQFMTLNLDNLAGSGTFIMGADFSQDKSDFLNIEGNATGDHQLLIESSGKDPISGEDLQVVHTGGGDANFSLVGGEVDLGTWSYGLKQVGSDWFIDFDKKNISPSTKSVIALYNTAPTVWYGELTSLRTRMGELRTNEGNVGVWMRTYGNRNDVSNASGFGYKQTQQGVSLGADAAVGAGDGKWLVGIMAGESHSDLDLARGTTGKVDSYYAGVYTTWLDSETGYYFDGVLKANRFLNSSTVGLSDTTQTNGSYNTVGLGTSLEFGRHIPLGNNYFIEPYTQVSGVVIRGKDYRLGNDMQADGNTTRSLLGKLGTTVGRTIDFGRDKTVQPYVRVAIAQEFAKNNQVQVNGNAFNNDLSGSRGEAAAGVAISLSKNMQIHVDYEYSRGKNIEQPWSANIGARYSW